MGIKFNPLIFSGFDATGAGSSTSIGSPIGGATPYSILRVDGSSNLSEIGPLTNGQLIIGSTGGAAVAATLSGTSNQISVATGAGSLTLSLPQDIAAVSSPSFTGLTLSGLTANRALTTNGSSVLTVSSVTATELGYVSGVTSSIQTQLNSKIPSSEKAAPLGVATLDGGGKIPAAQLPNSVMDYKGNWDASTNTPTLADGTGSAGDVYQTSVAGTQNLGSGPITFALGDWAVYNGTIWEKSINSNAVASVNGFTGIVTLDTDDIAEGATNLYFTTARVSNKTNYSDFALLNPEEIYIDVQGGNDTTGTGNVVFPFKTLEHVLTLTTNTAKHYVLFLAPGDYTTGPVTIPGNVSLIGKGATINNPVTLAVIAGADNQPLFDGVSLAISMDLSPASVAIVTFRNGTFDITRTDTTAGPYFFTVANSNISGLDLKGNGLISNCVFVSTATVQPGGQALLQNSIIGINMGVVGTGVIAMTGCTFSGTITGTINLGNTPTVRADSSSLGYGGVITTATIVDLDSSSYISFNPAVPANWSPAPTNVKDALDQLAVTGTGFANKALSNLNTTSINQNLLPSADVTRNLGSTTLQWLDVHASNIKNSGNITVLDVPNGILNDTLGNMSIDFTNRTLFNDLGNGKLDWSGNQVQIYTNDANGDMGVHTGIVSSIDSSGLILLETGTAVDGNSGSISLNTGNVSGIGNSGDILIKAGTVTSGTQGLVAIEGSQVLLTADVSTITISAATNILFEGNLIDGGGIEYTNALNPTTPQSLATKSYVDTAVGSAFTTGDIALTSFSGTNNQVAAANVTGLLFNPANVRSFEALVSVSVSATSSLFEQFKLNGIYNGTSWYFSQSSVGDSSLVTFTITNAGQIQYTSGNYSGFVSLTMKFRAQVTTV